MPENALTAILRGSVAGLAATAAMSGVMFAARRAGLMGKMPPERITEAGLNVLGIHTSERTENVLSSLAHMGYGAGGGALFAAIDRAGRLPASGPIAGAIFGLAIWVVSYAGWIPAFGIMPAPQRDRRRRPTSMILAHLVYGSTLGLLVHPRRP
jgi:hypothetical protein